jgi:hypothetical protein
MRELTIMLIAAAILSIGSLPWAEAATRLEKAGLRAAGENYMPIQEAWCTPKHVDSCPWHKKFRDGRCVPCMS